MKLISCIILQLASVMSSCWGSSADGIEVNRLRRQGELPMATKGPSVQAKYYSLGDHLAMARLLSTPRDAASSLPGVTSLSAICPGSNTERKEIASCLQQFLSAQTGPSTIFAPPAGYTYDATIKINHPLHLFGSGNGTVFTSAQRIGGPAGSFLDIASGADGTEIDHIKINGQNSVRNFTNAKSGQYFQTDPILVEANEVSIHDIEVTDSFDNCIAVSALDPDTGSSLVGRPYGYSIRHVRTSNCGNGAQKAGAGVNIGSGQTGTVEDIVDLGSYGGAFICDTGAGANGNFSNIISNKSAHQRGQFNYAIYAGCPNSNYNNLQAIFPGDHGIWFDQGATGNTASNLLIRNAPNNSLTITDPDLRISNIEIDSPGNDAVVTNGAASNGVDAVQIDSSSGSRKILISNLSIRSGFTKGKCGIAFTGSSTSITGALTGYDLDGAIFPFCRLPLAFKTFGTFTAAHEGHNLLINGNFSVNQREYTSGAFIATGAYGHDRWVNPTRPFSYTFTKSVENEFTAGGNLDTIVTIPDGGVLRQYIEALDNPGGFQTLSWSGSTTASLFYITRDANNNTVLRQAATGASPLTAMIPEGTSMVVQLNQGGTAANVKLEKGTAPTPFERPQADRELVRAQRYFQRLYSPKLLGLVNDDNHISRMGMQLSVAMRSPPQLVMGGNLAVFNGKSVGYISSITKNYSTKTTIEVDVSLTSDSVYKMGQTATIIQSKGFLDLDAELRP